MRLTWLGHSAFHLETATRSILLDPFWTGNPAFPQGYEDKVEKVDAIVLTHGHDDHTADAARLAKKHGAVIVAQYELAMWMNAQGAEQVEPMNTGGTVERDGVRYSMVPALHSSATIKDGTPITMGDPAGFVIQAEGASIYDTGDTGIFSDMALIQRIYRPKVGLVCIGDRFTMGPELAAMACNEFLDLETVIPTHYGTFPMLTGRVETFQGLVTRGKVVAPKPGETVEI